MSAFFLSINRDGSPFQSIIADNMMQAIDHFGHDQKNLIVKDNYALGYQSLWTVPEEVDERQPIYDQKSQSWFMLHGRIDNRAKLFKQLEQPASNLISDAVLFHRYYLKFGIEQMDQIIGSFACVIFYPETSQVVALRDSMGSRNLIYKITEQHIHIATYEMALVAHPSIDYRFNHSRIGRIIARLLEDRLSCVIDGLSVLPPSMALNIVDQEEPELAQFYTVDPTRRVLLENDQAYGIEFKRLLNQAVVRRARTIGKIGSMLSGGFDSVPITTLMAKNLGEHQLTAFSWVFERHPESDERLYSEAVCQRYCINQVMVNCDDALPKFDGVHGDLLYGYTDAVLYELFRARRWRSLIREAKYLYSQSESFFVWLKRYVLAPLKIVKRLLLKRRLNSKPFHPALQNWVLDTLSNQTNELAHLSKKALRPLGYELIFGSFPGEDIAFGRHLDAQYGLERRYPFRDRDLCEFMAAIPRDQLKRSAITRPIVRNAFANELPEHFLARTNKTSFYPVIIAGIKDKKHYLEWFSSDSSSWSFYVKKCYFSDVEQQNNDQAMVQWQCAYYDYWKAVCYYETVKNLNFINESNNS